METIRKHKLKALGALLGVDCLFYGLTNPAKASALILILGFILLVINIFAAVTGVISLIKWYGVSIGKQRLKIEIIITTILATLVALQSSGQLTSKDLVILLPLAAIGYFYLSYKKA